MNDDIDLAVLIIACLTAGYIMSLFERANGHRPFLVGYLIIAGLLVGDSLSAFFDWSVYTFVGMRVGWAFALGGTLIWAGRKR